MLRAFLHDRSKAGFALSVRTVMSTGMIWKSGYRFSEEIMLKHNVQQQSGRWAQRARCP